MYVAANGLGAYGDMELNNSMWNRDLLRKIKGTGQVTNRREVGGGT